jgi:glycosyltransferase involved in cell wall biosynthesis
MGIDRESAAKESQSPLVSVVIAVKNAAATVEASISSIQHQTLSDWELVLVEDDSTDGSREIVEKLIGPDSRARLLVSPGLGPGGARNMGISEARGRYVAILDADDIATQNRLERQVTVLEADRSLAAVGSAAYHFVRPGRAVGVRPGGPMSREELEVVKRQGALVVWSNSTMCWRKECLDELNGFDARFPQAEDAELMNRAMYRHNMTILGLPDRLVWYRLSRSSLSSVNLAQQRMIARYLELRNRCWMQGAAVPSLEEFMAQRRTLRERFRWARHDLAADLYREAGYRVAIGAWRGVAARMVTSTMLHPRYVLPKLWKQRLQMNRRRR